MCSGVVLPMPFAPMGEMVMDMFDRANDMNFQGSGFGYNHFQSFTPERGDLDPRPAFDQNNDFRNPTFPLSTRYGRLDTVIDPQCGPPNDDHNYEWDILSQRWREKFHF